MHRRYLTGQHFEKLTPFEAYHYASAVSLYNHRISETLAAADSSALWMGATMISFMVCSSMETQNPRELWPLSPTGPASSFWMRTHDGVRTLYGMLPPSNPFIEGSRGSVGRCLGVAVPQSGIVGIPKDLADLCELVESSHMKENPYHTPLYVISSLLVDTTSEPLRFLTFLNLLDDRFKALLEKKDARALVLMAIWYKLVPRSAWWIWPRAQLEHLAICLYLDAHHRENRVVHRVMATWAPSFLEL